MTKIEKIKDIQYSEKTVTLEKAEIDKGQLSLRVSCPAEDCRWTGILLSYIYKIEDDREDHLVQPDSVRETDKGTALTCTIDLENFPFRQTNWMICAVYEKDGERYAAGIRYKAKKLSAKELLEGKYSYTDSTDHIVFICAVKGGCLGLRYREKTEFDGRLTKIKEVIAYRRYKQREDHFKKKKIWLIYEKKCEKAQDNGYYLFKYCMDNNIEEKVDRSIYYILRKDAPDMKKLLPYKKNVILFGSMKHMMYLLAAKLLISSDSKNHGYILQYDRSIIGQSMRKKKFVFLGHGVLALKKLNATFHAERMNAVLTTVTSEAEADIVVNELGYERSAAAVTGYARFDGLRDDSEGRGKILIMPTHRSWLYGVDRETFVNSEYYRRYMDLINSPELISLLKEHDLTADFYLHPSINEHFDAFSSSDERVHLVPMGSVPLDDLMMQCSLLVTDYSSVCWDLYYMGKPAVFYQYDVDKYMDTWGSYIDLTKDTPGDRADTLEQLLSYIKESIDSGFRLSDYWQDRREQHYKYIDRDNCKRIVEVLKERKL